MSRTSDISLEHSRIITSAMERLEQFEPAVVRNIRRDALSYAVAYVEQYQGDVPQLEREREFLLSALALAWEQEKYSTVVRLMTGLAYLAGRLGNNREGQRILLQGIEACRWTHDRYHLTLFLNRYSNLCWSCGDYAQAWQIWEESRVVADELGRPTCFWEPLFSLTYIADILFTYRQVQCFADALLHAQDEEALNSLAVVLFVRAFYARLQGRIEVAYHDLDSCLRPFSQQNTGFPAYRQFFELAVQTEFARMEGDFSRSYDSSQSILSLALTCCDPYTIAILLLDQIVFAYQQGMLPEVSSSIHYLARLTCNMGASHLRNSAQFYLQQLPASLRCPVQQRHASNTQLHILSQREREILQLVSAGLSNQEIAASLVISIGTTKKHLEHIYEKLDARSRTQAVARARGLGMLA